MCLYPSLCLYVFSSMSVSLNVTSVPVSLSHSLSLSLPPSVSLFYFRLQECFYPWSYGCGSPVTPGPTGPTTPTRQGRPGRTIGVRTRTSVHPLPPGLHLPCSRVGLGVRVKEGEDRSRVDTGTVYFSGSHCSTWTQVRWVSHCLTSCSGTDG